MERLERFGVFIRVLCWVRPGRVDDWLRKQSISLFDWGKEQALVLLALKCLVHQGFETVRLVPSFLIQLMQSICFLLDGFLMFAGAVYLAILKGGER